MIGFLALFALFGAIMFVLIKPPEALKPYILPPDQQQSPTIRFASPAPVEDANRGTASVGGGTVTTMYGGIEVNADADVKAVGKDDDIAKESYDKVSLDIENTEAESESGGGLF